MPTLTRCGIGAPASDNTLPHDPRRDAVTLPLIKATLARGVPLFAICRGMQELNVAMGGTLVAEVQELPGRLDHRAPASDDNDLRFAIRQDVVVEPGGVLAGILGAGTVRVNSLHRQAVDKLGQLVESHWHILDKAATREVIPAFRAIGQLNVFTDFADPYVKDCAMK